jgi:hypothetical protein
MLERACCAICLEVRHLVRRPVLVHDTAKLMPERAYAQLDEFHLREEVTTRKNEGDTFSACNTGAHLRQGVSA